MILRIFKMIATSDFLTALECTKFVFGRGSAPDPSLRTALPQTLAGLKGPASKGEGEGERKGRGGKRNRRGGTAPLSQISGSAPVKTTLVWWSSQQNWCSARWPNRQVTVAATTHDGDDTTHFRR